MQREDVFAADRVANAARFMRTTGELRADVVFATGMDYGAFMTGAVAGANARRADVLGEFQDMRDRCACIPLLDEDTQSGAQALQRSFSERAAHCTQIHDRWTILLRAAAGGMPSAVRLLCPPQSLFFASDVCGAH